MCIFANWIIIKYYIYIMRTTKLTFAGIILFFMALLSGCTEDTIKTETADEVSVKLRLDETLQEKAYVRLTHNGSRGDYWYYIVTEDLDTDAKLLLNAELAAELETSGQIEGNVGTNKSIALTGLKARTDYRVIASRISSQGEIVGEVAELCFVTLRDPDVFEVYESWSISYKERKVEQEPYYETEVFDCKVAGDTAQTYIPCLLTKEDFQSAYGGNIRRCFEDYVAYLNLSNVKWPNEVRKQDSEFLQDRLRHGDYILFMIGVDETGELTGYYTRTDCKIQQEQPVEEYNAWIGNWVLSGEYQGTKISYDVEIAPDENNLYYKMYGWERLTALDYFEALPDMLPIQLYFYRPTGNVYVVSEALPDLEDPTLAEFYDFFFYGCVEVDGEVIVVDADNYSMARFTMTDADHASVTPEMFPFQYNGAVYERPFLYFGYFYTSALYGGYTPVTTDMMVPAISTMKLVRK